jgi:hypothetical protein
MRKQKKRKLRSCPMCKPNKTGGACRWNVRERQAIKIAESEGKDAVAVDIDAKGA